MDRSFDILSSLANIARPELGPPDDPARQEWPELCQLLSARLAGGKVREPGRVTVHGAPGCWRVNYTDIDLGLSLSVDVQRLADIWQALQDALKGGRPCQWAELRRGRAATRRLRALQEEAQAESQRKREQEANNGQI